jgi:hypothetical protein
VTPPTPTTGPVEEAVHGAYPPENACADMTFPAQCPRPKLHTGYVLQDGLLCHVPAASSPTVVANLVGYLVVCDPYGWPSNVKYAVIHGVKTGSNLIIVKPSALMLASLSLLLA